MLFLNYKEIKMKLKPHTFILDAECYELLKEVSERKKLSLSSTLRLLIVENCQPKKKGDGNDF